MPRLAEVTKYVLRVHMNVGCIDIKKSLKQLHVRLYVILLLLDYLIDQNHEVFRGIGGVVQLKAHGDMSLLSHFIKSRSFF